MRTAAICPTCAIYYNAACILYDGTFLAALGVAPLDPLDVILGKINTAVQPLTGTTAPSSIPLYIGQFYINTTIPELYVGLSTTSPDWGVIGVIITTTTTSTTSTTTSHP